MDHYKSVHPLKYYQDYLAHSVRPDGRGLSKFRNVSININSINTADGSAIVRIGNSCAVCGFKAELGPPKSECPEDGFLLINVDLPPLCSSQFRPGPPSEKAQVLTAYINDIVGKSRVIDLKSLCIYVDKLVWTLHCDIICTNYDGAVIDACFSSFIAALQNVTLPKVEYNSEINTTSVDESCRIPLNILCKPVSTSFAVFDEDTILADPCAEEESLSLGLLTVVVAGDELCSIHKPGGAVLSDIQIQKCISEAKARAKWVNNVITSALQQS